MKFQNPSMHGSWTDRRTDNPKPICPVNFFEVGGITKSLYHRAMRPKDVERMANSVDPDQEQSDLGLHCSSRSRTITVA